MRIIIDVDDIEDGLLGWRAVKASIREGYDNAAFGYGEGASEVVFHVRRTKTGYSSRQSRKATSTDTKEG